MQYTTLQVAEILGISTFRVHKLADRGELPCTPSPTSISGKKRRTLRFEETDVKAFKAKQPKVPTMSRIDAAAFLGRSVTFIAEEVKRGALAEVPRTGCKHAFYLVSEIERYKAAQSILARAKAPAFITAKDTVQGTTQKPFDYDENMKRLVRLGQMRDEQLVRIEQKLEHVSAIVTQLLAEWRK